jgi:RNA polymerase sigma factor (sigma-70 family)
VRLGATDLASKGYQVMGRTAALQPAWTVRMSGAGTQHETLLEAAVAGDRAAREAVLGQAAAVAMRVAMALLGSRDEAKGACQEVLIRLHRSLDRVDPSRPLSPYVRRITVNVCRDRARKRRRRSIEVPTAEVPAVSGGEPSVERIVAGRHLGESIQGCMEELTRTERTAFVLRHVEGLSAVEAARCMGCSPGTVRGYAHRARGRIRERLLAKHPELEEDLP